MVTGFDVETSTIEKGHVHHPDNFLVSYSLADGNSTRFRYFRDPDFLSFNWDSIDELVGFNIKFDIQWLYRNGIKIPESVRIYDVSLAEQILTAQQSPMVSLNEVCAEYGIEEKLDIVAGYWEQGISTEDIPIPILKEYNNDDAEKALRLREIQLHLLSPKQLQLLYQQGEDLLVLAEAEMHGVKFDKGTAESSYRGFSESLQAIEKDLEEFLPAGIPAPGFNWDSGDQLSALLYGGTITYDYSIPENRVYGKTAKTPGEPYVYNRWFSTDVVFPQRFVPIDGTEVKKTREDPNAKTRFYQVDDTAIRQLRSRDRQSKSLLNLLARKAKLSKVLESFEGIFKRVERYRWGDYLHGQFNQNIARTGRLTSSNPNMQNSDENVDECLISRYD